MKMRKDRNSKKGTLPVFAIKTIPLFPKKRELALASFLESEQKDGLYCRHRYLPLSSPIVFRFGGRLGAATLDQFCKTKFSKQAEGMQIIFRYCCYFCYCCK